MQNSWRQSCIDVETTQLEYDLGGVAPDILQRINQLEIVPDTVDHSYRPGGRPIWTEYHLNLAMEGARLDSAQRIPQLHADVASLL